uniref:CSON012510 protein n=1 Tax=Culicoides sonorensis TaxID=179676 RepID=A0A336LRK5_CULSO
MKELFFNDFVYAGISSSCATIFTNPLEVVKIRMQLQGELGLSNQTHYRNIPQALVQIAKNDGITGLQKGLTPSLYFQFFLNAFRLGIYTTAHEHGLTRNKETGHVSIMKSAFWGATGGFIGAALSNPFFMLKTHLQSQAKKEIAVGYQHQHTGMFSALKTIYTQHGVKGLYRSVNVNLPRALLGSGGQLAAFGYTKDFLQRNHSKILPPSIISIISGATAGTVMAITMTPPDVLATRLYNQGVTECGKGIYYKGVVDCFVKIVKSEGIMALYKGFWAHYIRIGPHSTLVLVFFDQIKALDLKYKEIKLAKTLAETH